MRMSEFGRTLEQEIPRLRRYARVLTRDSVQADDLVQTTLVRALAKSRLWQPDTNLRHWLFALLHNQRVSDVRRLIREQRGLADERVVSMSPSSPEPDARISLLELDRAIAGLPEARRQVVLLIGLEQMTYNEVADIQGGPNRHGPFPAGTRTCDAAHNLGCRSGDRRACLGKGRRAV
jgi:RNA polymerase sigma-70 factor, ECF subfamily